MKVTIFAALLAGGLAATSSARADDLTAMMRAAELGTVIAAEEFCGLTYDQTAIQAWIAVNVPADDMGFPSLLTTNVMGAEFQQRKMTGSAKTAHCAAITRTARHFGFAKD